MWPKGPYRWIENRTLYISVPFTWNLPAVKKLAEQKDFRYDEVVAGSPAVQLRPDYLGKIGAIGESPGALQRINPEATRTTTGCPNHCSFCGIGQGLIEPGGFRELPDWPDNPVICDNNLLAASKKHFDRVVDRLKKHEYADFNQGLEAGRITAHIARRLCELKKPLVRLAWDTMGQEKRFMRGVETLLKAGFPKSRISVYVLIGFEDTPVDALYRLQTLSELGLTTSPMRYTPLYSLEKDYVNGEKGWTNDLLLDYMKYWFNRRFFRGIPFAEFDRKKRNFDIPGQKNLLDRFNNASGGSLKQAGLVASQGLRQRRTPKDISFCEGDVNA